MARVKAQLGKRIRANASADPWIEAEVVGVVADVRQQGLEATAEGGMYLPFFPPFQPSRWVAIRAAGDPLALVPALRRTFSELDPHRPITRVFTGQGLYESGAQSRLATTRIFGVFSLVALAPGRGGDLRRHELFRWPEDPGDGHPGRPGCQKGERSSGSSSGSVSLSPSWGRASGSWVSWVLSRSATRTSLWGRRPEPPLHGGRQGLPWASWPSPPVAFPHYEPVEPIPWM